jgi:hypothetical protein
LTSYITKFSNFFPAKIEVVKCPKDPREWRQVFEIYPVGINEKVVVDLEMMCQCDCEKPGDRVRKLFPTKIKLKGTLFLLISTLLFVLTVDFVDPPPRPVLKKIDLRRSSAARPRLARLLT